MSVEAITWALRQPITHSSAKFVLVVLANCASGATQEAYPSIAYLAEATGQDRKTVVANLARLLEWGLIEDTGERRGTTRQIIVYRVLSGPDLFATGAEKRNRSENGTVPKTAGKSPVFSGNSTENGTRNRQNHQGTGECVGASDACTELDASGNVTPDVAADVPRESGTVVHLAGNAAGRACRAMRDAGCSRTNPSHPDLLAALAEGVTESALADTAGEAIEAGADNPFAWAISTARRRHKRGASQLSAGTDHAARTHGRESPAARTLRIAREAQQRDDDAAGLG